MATRAAQVELDDEPRVDVVEHEVGETRRLVKILTKKILPAWLLGLAIQNVVVLPAWMAFAAPVAGALRIQIAGV